MLLMRKVWLKIKSVRFSNSQLARHGSQVMLISHQWAGRRHPDPKFEQFSVLQKAGWQIYVSNCFPGDAQLSQLRSRNRTCCFGGKKMEKVSKMEKVVH